MKRRTFLAALAAAPLAHAAPAPALSARDNVEDFDALWRAIDTGYAYFEAPTSWGSPGSRIAWKRARELWRPKARSARTRDELVVALEGALAHLCDDAATLAERLPTSPRQVPSETDLWAEWKGAAATITAVKAFSDADVAGLQPGHVVTHVNGIPIAALVRERLPAGATGDAAHAWGLRRILAGPRQGSMRLSLRAADGPAKVEVERSATDAANGPPLIARRMGEERDLGYIRIRNVLGDPALVPRFDAALAYLMDTRALILDLRETPDGGSRIVCESLLGHFVESEAAWQLRQVAGRSGRTPDVVKPGTTRYRGGLVVLVDRWTAGEAEALATGLDGAANAVLVGTPMAGLHGDAQALTLPHSRIVARFPAQRTFHVNGTPRELVRPDVEVDLASPSGGPGDPILYQGLKAASSAPSGRSAPR